MSLERAFAIGAAGLGAQRTRMETVSSNLANLYTTRTPEGGPYRRLSPVFAAEPASLASGPGSPLRSVRVEGIVTGSEPPLLRYEPGHPDADAAGFVAYPAIESAQEMIDMLSATRSYQANVTLVRSVREMFRAALQIIA
jgi:flagellar basal-body rod protein FlgC